MSHDAAQPLEQVMATIFTCRSLVKYNLALSEEQKGELLTEIDLALQVLRSQLVATTSMDAKLLPSPAQQTHAEPTVTPNAEYGPPKDEQKTLQALYRVYHSYLDMRRGANANTSNIAAFVARFNDAITVIDDLQRLIERNYGMYDVYRYHRPVEEPLQNVKNFVADLYYGFMEFVRALSEVLQQNEVQPDTDKLTSMQREPDEEEGLCRQSLAPLLRIYEAHLHINERKGSIASRVNDTTAFLEFLKESFDDRFQKRDDFIMQLNKVIRLLLDLSRLLSDYEHAISVLLYYHGPDASTGDGCN